MTSFNSITLIGNLTRDPEQKFIPSGKAVCKFTIAVNDKRGDNEKVCFMPCECWGKTAEAAGRYLSKGKPVLVDGRIEQDNWTGDDGKKRTSYKVVASRLVFLSGSSVQDEQSFDEIPF